MHIREWTPRGIAASADLGQASPSARARTGIAARPAIDTMGPRHGISHLARLNIDLSINDYDREIFAERRTVVELREGEGIAHVALKLLGMALFHAPGLVTEPVMDDDDRFRPDLLLRSDDGRPALWVECGQCRVQKLDKITFKHYDARVIVLKRTAREANELMGRCNGEVRRLHAIEFIGFDLGFVDALAGTLTGKTDWIVILSGSSLQVVAGGATHVSALYRFSTNA